MADVVRIGQCKKARIRIKDSYLLPMQIDGEPWEQGPCDINIERFHQAPMLLNSDS
jgi:hypothetical protein